MKAKIVKFDTLGKVQINVNKDNQFKQFKVIRGAIEKERDISFQMYEKGLKELEEEISFLLKRKLESLSEMQYVLEKANNDLELLNEISSKVGK